MVEYFEAVKFFLSERLMATLIGTFTGGLISYVVNIKLQNLNRKKQEYQEKLKEEKIENKKKEDLKIAKFNKIIKALLILEINGRHLKVADNIIATSNRKKGTNHYFPFVDTTDHCKELIEFLEISLIYNLYWIQTRFTELVFLIERGKEFHKDTIKNIVFNNANGESYLGFEAENNKLIQQLIIEIHILLKHFFSSMKDYLKKEYPNEKIPPIILDFTKEMSNHRGE